MLITPQEQPCVWLIGCHCKAGWAAKDFGHFRGVASDGNSAGFLSPSYQHVKKWSWSFSFFSSSLHQHACCTSVSNEQIERLSKRDKCMLFTSGTQVWDLMWAVNQFFADWSSFCPTCNPFLLSWLNSCLWRNCVEARSLSSAFNLVVCMWQIWLYRLRFDRGYFPLECP